MSAGSSWISTARRKGFPAHATDEWLAVVTAGLQAAGYEDPQVAATLIVAASRGLLLDLQVTSDRERADAAFSALLASIHRVNRCSFGRADAKGAL